MLLLKCSAALLGVGLLVPVGLSDSSPEPTPVPGHCQIPCGIYGDDTRFAVLGEHITTIEKSMKQIVELQKDPSANANQLVRWVMNKEQHADEFTEILTKYFLQQRIKTAEAESNAKSYNAKLGAIHQLMVLCMKAKQTTDTAHTDAMKKVLHDFVHLYDPNHKH